MNETFLIIGGGQSGSQAVDSLRREGFDGRLVLVGEEQELPYQRPPLSKKYLAGEMSDDRLPFRHRAFYEEHRVDLRLGTRVLRLDCAARVAELDGGERIRYDRALLALGAAPRRLACPGAQLPGVHVLRSAADAAAIRARFSPDARVVIVGGGYIGLETAATCRHLGLSATVLEMADRVMNRVVAPAVSAYFERAHRAHGVRIDCGARVAAIEGRDRVERVICADGSRHDADIVIVGIGATPVVDLALASGLAVEDGILVDERCRTSDPSVFAAGDCTNHPSPHYGRRLRLESVDNAFEQAKVAASNMVGKDVIHDRVPWFWSDQYQHKLLIVGLSAGHDRVVVRGEPDSGAFSVLYLRDRELIVLESVDDSKDYMAARKLIASRARIDPARAQDRHRELKDCLA
ncbi:MAG: FAD-dependent oxidoreductase [Gammaproteobacteria bacterium]|nr:FAD-dependent oxidoreductase [Gammaproteobacteria bacterium]